MTPKEMEKALERIFLLIDTREQPTEEYHRRIAAVGLPAFRKKLSFGDYSCGYLLPDGTEVFLDGEIAVERKMSLDEICANFTKGRGRFKREFERAAKSGAKIHLIIEGGSWEKVMAGRYRSRLNPQSLMGSFMAFADRYDISVHFCKKETTPQLLRSIFYYHIRNRLSNELEFEV